MKTPFLHSVAYSPLNKRYLAILLVFGHNIYKLFPDSWTEIDCLKTKYQYGSLSLKLLCCCHCGDCTRVIISKPITKAIICDNRWLSCCWSWSPCWWSPPPAHPAPPTRTAPSPLSQEVGVAVRGMGSVLVLPLAGNVAGNYQHLVVLQVPALRMRTALR